MPNGTNGDDVFNLQGQLQQLQITLVNPYTGEEIDIDEERYVNTTFYNGMDGNDILIMTSISDTVFLRGPSGNQVIHSVEQFFGGSGNDIIILSDAEFTYGDVIVYGQNGNDIIWTNVGNDTIYGGNGDDILNGGPGNDMLYGENNNDTLRGADGDDTLDGGNGDDMLIGGVGMDTYVAGLGHDIIIEDDTAELNVIRLPNGITFADLIFLQVGLDMQITVGGLGTITIQNQFAPSLQDGIDTLIFSDNSTFDLRTIEPETAPLPIPTEGDDYLELNNDPNDMHGLGGNDTILGLGGADSLYGDEGDDVIDGGDGDDEIEGGDGNDTLLGGADNDRLSGGAGVDHLQGGSGNDILHSFADAVWPSGWGAWNVGSPGYAGTNQIIGLNGRNRSFDIFDGGEGYDILNLTDGNDAIFLDDGYSARPDGTDGPRLIGIEEINAGGGDDIVDLTSFDYAYGDVVINGGDGNDYLWSSSGNDTLHGDAGNDQLFGGAGDDALYGDGENDTLYGGFGNDRLEGGDGNDVLYGGNNTPMGSVDKSFSGGVYGNMYKPSTSNQLPAECRGVAEGNLTVDHDMTATITFRSGTVAGNTLGIYRIAADGTIEAASILFGKVGDAGINVAHQIDLPVGEDGGSYGFFIITNGYKLNNGFNGLDIGEEGHIRFVYDYGGTNERAATIYDNGAHVTMLYDDGQTVRVLNGSDYHTTERDGTAAINDDGAVHVMSGLAQAGNPGVLRIGFEDGHKLGDKDFNDVLFDLNINPYAVDVSEEGNDILIGGAGDDMLYGEAGDDILIVGEGADQIYGGVGSDQIVYNFMDSMVDHIHGFEAGAGGDVLNLTDILDGFDAETSDIHDFIQLVNNGGHTEIYVNADGQGDDFTLIGLFEGGLTETIEDLLNNGNLVVDQSVLV